MKLLILLVLWLRPNGAIKEEIFQEKVDTVEVISVVGGRANLPCDLTPPFPSDEPHLILFYKDVYGTPIYSFDMRQKEKGRHWKDDRALGSRAFFHYKETGMRSETGAKQIASFLTVEALNAQDAGFYRCRVDFKEAPTKNTKIHLKLIVPPSTPIIRSEHGKILDKISEPVQEGSTLTLICETQGGEPLPRLTWKRGQVLIDDVVEEVDPQNRVVRNYLKMPSLHRKDHDDVLSCHASNTNLTKPTITYININMVFPPIRAKIVREWTFFSAGQAYNVSCQVLGSRPPAVTAIYVGPSQLREVNYHVSPDGNVSTTTVIFIPDESDQGKFLSCRAENVQLSSSAVEDQWKLEIHYLPRATLKMSSTLDGDLVRKGDTVYLQCEVKGNPSVHTIQWTFEGQVIEPKKNTNLFATEDTLIIRGVQEANNGVYQCTATNQVGQGVSNSQTVNVKAFPSCANADLHTVVEVERHQATQLNCQYHSSSSGSLEFRWSMNSSKDYVDIAKSQYTTQADKSVLTFSAKTDMDFGTYTCQASDAVGQASKPCTFQIIPKGESNALRNCSAANQTFESLSIVCMNSSHTNPNQRYILEVFNSRSHDMVVNISTNQPVFHIRGLTAGTEYRVRIYSVNDNGGVSEHTVFETFTLQPAEKQLAATTTDLATNNPMRLLPIVAVLIAIVLLLVILAVIFVIIIRGRNGCANTTASSALAAAATASPPSSTSLAAVANASYQKPHSSHSLRQPLTSETTSIDDYHHHHHPPRSGERRETSPTAYQYRQPQNKHQPLASELNSPDLILPAAAAAAAAAASKGGYSSITTSHQSGGRGQPQPAPKPPPHSYEELLLASNTSAASSRTASVKKSIMKKPSSTQPQSECQYAQLLFDNSTGRNHHFASDDSVLYMNNSPKYHQQQTTNYATIDHSRRHKNSSKINTSRSSKGLMHSASCPFKQHSSSSGDPHKKAPASAGLTPQQTTPAHRNTSSAAGSRSGTLKRVAFKDEQTVHDDDGASSVRLIPSNNTLSDGDPVPAPPPGYESQPGFAITDDTQLLPPPPTSEEPTSLLKKSNHPPSSTQDTNKCSTTNEIESRL